MTRQTFHTPAPVVVEVSTASGVIAVETIDGEESTVTVEGSEKLLERMLVELTGNRLVVKLRDRGPFGIPFSLRDIGIGNSDVRVHVTVPHSSTAELSTVAATVELRGHFASLAAKTVSGNLALDGDVDGDADVRAVSGDARLGRVGGTLRARSVSGRITASAVGGDVTAKSVSGDVHIGTAREGTFKAQSVSGNIEVGVPSGTSVDVDAGSTSGDLSSEVPLGADAASLGDGPLLVVRGSTVSGDFRLFRTA